MKRKEANPAGKKMVEDACARKFSCVYVYQKRQQEKHREINRKKELIGRVGIKERKKIKGEKEGK